MIAASLRTLACLLGLLIALVPSVEAAARPPATPALLDPIGDANFLNDSGYSNRHGTPFVGNIVTQPDLEAAADLVALWFSNDAATISVHIQTETMPEYEGVKRHYWVRANPERPLPDTPDCLGWGIHMGDQGSGLSDNYARVHDVCQGDYLGHRRRAGRHATPRWVGADKRYGAAVVFGKILAR